MRWLRIPWAAYNARNGETWPACGDVDGDGKDEIVVGLGPGGGGWLHVFNDAGAGYASMAWRRVPWGWYDGLNGETRPAAGDIDGDGKEEIVVGLGPFPPAGGWFCMFDDGVFGFPFRGWRRVPYGAYNAANGETWPVTGDIDGDGREEMIVGLGTFPANGGWMAFFDDPPSGGFLGWRRLPWMAYNLLNGETHPATANLDGDASAELVVGLDSGGRGFMWIADDWGTGVAPRGWYWIPWGGYAWAQGLSYPRAKALMPASAQGPEVPAQGGEGSPPEAHETLSGTISGNVSSGGSAVEGAWVTAYSDSWAAMLSTRTDAAGDYLLEGLEPGAYFVEASAEGNIAPEYYDDVPGIPSKRGTATTVTVYPAIETSEINFDLGPGGTVSGLVSDTGLPPALPIVGAIVTAYVEGGSWVQVAQGETGVDGRYTLEGLAAGTYYLEATPPTPDYMGEYYDDVPAIPSNQSKATAVVLSGGQNVTGKNFALGSGSSISGKVTGDPAGTPIEGAAVILYVDDGGEWLSVGSTYTDASGDYRFGGLPRGTYYLEANRVEGGYAGEYYDNVGALVVNRASATPIVLGESASQTGKDFALGQGGSITGKVIKDPGMLPVEIPIEGAVVTVYEQDWGAVAGQTVTDSNGDYSVGNLPSGQYYVSADGGSVGCAAEYYDNQPMTEEGKTKATRVAVTAGGATGNVGFTLKALNSISGSVTDDNVPAKPLSDALVEAIDPQTLEVVASASSVADGSYQVLLEPGDYYVSAVAGGHAREYFREEREIGSAQLVSLPAGIPAIGVDFTLTPVGVIRVVSDVQSAPFTLEVSRVVGPRLDLIQIDDNTGPDRLWESGEVHIGTSTITWHGVPGYNTPPPETQELSPGDLLTFFGHYALKEGYKVNTVSTAGAGAERKVRIEWYSEVGKMYQVQGTDKLVSSPWQNIGSPVPGTGAMMSYEELIGAKTRRFLRVEAF